jgi:signal-transduction protein with cAMP-binding, CBS, and nucleotidyltransferase domain
LNFRLKRVIAEGLNPKETHVGQYMSDHIRGIDVTSTVENAMTIMTEQRHRHLPVLRDGEVIGVVSSGDLIKSSLINSQSETDHLWQYITESHSSYAGQL